MAHIVETRRAGRRASEMMSFGDDVFSDSTAPVELQSSKLCTRYGLSDALGRVIAEHISGDVFGRATR